MNWVFAILALTAGVIFHMPAIAAVITILPPGQLTSGNPVATFDGLPQTPYGATTPAGPFTDGGASFSGTGLIMKNAGLSSLGLYAEPLHDTTNYLAILGGRSETITYSGPRHRFGLYWGSIDSYNTVAFYTNAGDAVPFLTYTGSQIRSADRQRQPGERCVQSLRDFQRYRLQQGGLEFKPELV